MAKIDIIMGIYNCEDYLADSINSILGQTFTDWRLIMCDDGSTDSSLKIAREYEKKYPTKIVVLKNKRNMGLNYTLNNCLRLADAEYVARMDGDDLSNPCRLEKELDFLAKNKEYAFVSTAVETYDKKGVWGELYYKENPDRYDFLKINPFAHPAVMIRREALKDVGYYSVDKRLIRVEDFHLWFKLYAKGYKGHNLQEILYSYRDDRNATLRRSWTNRRNEYFVRKIGYKMLNMPRHLRFYKYRPIILALLPKSVCEKLHRNRLRRK
ncbi:glycosyltransferase [Candidatus Saccharibacteria bacterium]|nr:glycosyltransferase [Candidatus Saccharibacteria bacterium]